MPSLKKAFEAAGLPYFNPHSFRDTLVQLAETLCQAPEEFKVWSQNLGHEKVLTTFYSYGGVAPSRQAVIAHKAVPSNDGLDVDALATALASKLLNQRHTSVLNKVRLMPLRIQLGAFSGAHHHTVTE